jgi:hypothetical protein
MARTLPQHKVQYDRFLNPGYSEEGLATAWGSTNKSFEDFHQARLNEIPDEGTPAEGYLYNSHMGAYVRSLDVAKYHFIQAKLAFSGRPVQPTVTAVPPQ